VRNPGTITPLPHLLLVFPPRAPQQFAATISANCIHLFGALRAKCAFETANVSLVGRAQHHPALFTCFFHFERHGYFPFSLRPLRVIITILYKTRRNVEKLGGLQWLARSRLHADSQLNPYARAQNNDF
jgi:hypothetical protein